MEKLPDYIVIYRSNNTCYLLKKKTKMIFYRQGTYVYLFCKNVDDFRNYIKKLSEKDWR